MHEITSFAEANKILQSFVPPSQAKYTLERMRRLMDYLGNPEDQLTIVHVAGTSGKSSTCYYISAMLRAAGYTVGLTVSPHIDEVNERVQINGLPLPEKQFCRQLSQFLTSLEGFAAKPTYFEVLIAFMYWLFAQQPVDYAVVEVGLGGLLDGTNVAGRADKVCVITDIGLDHTHVLGQTVEEITAQKAGIIHPHNVVFSYQQSDAVMTVLREVCQQNQADLHEILPAASTQVPRQLPLFQRRNWYLASHVAQYVLQRAGHQGLSSDRLRQTANTLVPARMEVCKVGNKIVIVDGSHNEQKISTLLKSIRHKYPGQPLAMLISFGHNKSTSLPGNLRLLTRVASHMIVTTFKLGQDEVRLPINPKKIVEVCHHQGFYDIAIEIDPEAAFQQLLKRPEQLLLVTGSFYLLNHIRPLIMKKR
ncbi:hypothetical protein HY218_01525 [Candidatus Saccharibacteria bacterium]|nr:hypothetical protein [Candidatus Saccharibacteria bacterium]